jgi:hypothetical protein
MNMAQQIAEVIRLIVTIALLIRVWQTSDWWVAILLSLAAVGAELQFQREKQANERTAAQLAAMLTERTAELRTERDRNDGTP